MASGSPRPRIRSEITAPVRLLPGVGPIAEITTAVSITADAAVSITPTAERKATAYTADSSLLTDVQGIQYADRVSPFQTY